MDWATLIGIAATLAFCALGVALRFAIRQALGTGRTRRTS